MARWLPPYEPGPYTPAQGARQADRFLAGLRRQRGWRGALARLVAIAALVALLSVVVLMAVNAARIR
jgi:hypothetical protein